LFLRLSRQGRAFLLAVVLGPLLLHLAASLVLGMQLRDIWGMPLWTFASVYILCLLPADVSDLAWRRFALAWALVGGALAGGTLASNLLALRSSPQRIHYPGRLLSHEIRTRWLAIHGTPLPIAAGDWWLAGNVCVHAPHPVTLYASREPAAPRMDLDTLKGDPARFVVPEPAASPWTGDADLSERGGVLLWDATVFGDELPVWAKRRFPQAIAQAPLELPFAAGGRRLRVGWATVAPENRN
jgi:hypothetical protein